MRVLFTTYSQRTHFLLLAPLAWALRTAGHEVRVAVQPQLVDDVTQAGLTAVPVGHDRDVWTITRRLGPERVFGRAVGLPVPYDAMERPPEEVTWEYLHDGYRDFALLWHRTSNQPLIPDLVDFARYWQPDLVVWDASTYAGAIAAKACGAAHARVLAGADIFAITRELFLRIKAGREDPLADWLGAYGRRYGFDFSEDLVTGHFTIDQLPASLRIRGETRYLPMRYVPYGGPAVVPSWLRKPAERPRVALSMGLTGLSTLDFQDVLDSLSDVDIELIATLPEDGLRVPDNARLVPFVPLPALLPTCSVAIHHAGVGTLGTAVAAAVPQLALPYDADSPAVAARLAAQGSGLAMHADEATGSLVRDSVLRLLAEPGFRLAAAALRDEMLAMPTPNELVPDVEELTTKNR